MASLPTKTYMNLFQALLVKNIANGQGMEGPQRDARRALGMQVVRGAFPGAHPVLQGALAAQVTQRLNGEPATAMTAEELRARVGGWATDTWIDNNFPTLVGPARQALRDAIVRARGH